MANKLKSKSTNISSDAPAKEITDQLKPEKEEKVSLKEFAKDERILKITGAISLFISLFLFVSFISYLFTWEEDQSEILKGFSVFKETVEVHNLFGALGAYISHFFIYKGFGVSSLLLCTFFFIVGINLLFGKKIWSVWRNVRYVITGMLVLSVSFAFLFKNAHFSYGGAVGKMIEEWLENMMGYAGTGALLFVVALSYIIWQFNPVFKLPDFKKQKAENTNEETLLHENLNEDKAVLTNSEEDEVMPASSAGNFLKNNGETI